jgi:hypothetical protein
MTFEEVSKKYPLGMIMGEFCPTEETKTKQQVYDSLRRWEYHDSFYIQGKDRNTFHRVIIYYYKCEGYRTIDGKYFQAYTTDYAGCMARFEEPAPSMKDAFMIPPIEDEDYEEKLQEAFAAEWLKKRTETPIFNRKQLEVITRYEF